MRRPQTHLLWLLLILLVGAALRLYQLESIPPGLTHDEADHGLDAWAIVAGDRPVYLTTANGREPLFDYATAGLMALIGRTYLAGRLTAVFFGLIFLAGSYAWSRHLFSRRVALLNMAGLAVGFWPLLVSRQMLRTITLPALLTLALFLFLSARDRRSWLRLVGAGLCLGLSFYSYIPARLLWLLLPGLVGYGLLQGHRERHEGVRLSLVLALAALVGWPLFHYLNTNPGAETRITQLAQPLEAALQGDLSLLAANTSASLALFSFSGDGAWRYNVAGRPWLGPFMSILFYAGLGLALIYTCRRQPRKGNPAAGSFLALLWLALGFVPAAVTGPDLATTQAIGLLPVLYLFPALAIAWGWQRAERHYPAGAIFLPWGVAGAFLLLALSNGRAYFLTWANHPEVRLQYESSLVATLNFLQADGQMAAISTAQPGPFHAQAVAALILGQDPGRHQWFDGRTSLAWSAETAYLVSSGLAPLRSELVTGAPLGEIPLRQDDVDQPVLLYSPDALALRPAALTSPPGQYQFGAAVQLLGYHLESAELLPGQTVSYLTAWRVLERPTEAWILFTHVSGADGVPVAQQDLLGVPTAGWRASDYFYQLHEVQLPDSLPAGTYQIRTGFYYCPAACSQGTTRLALQAQSDGAEPSDSDILAVTTITVGAEAAGP